MKLKNNIVTFIAVFLLYDFKSGLNATQSCQRINSAFGGGKIALRTAQHWFKRFPRKEKTRRIMLVLVACQQLMTQKSNI